jgi:hypothetical protein
MHSIIYVEPLKIHKVYQGTSFRHMMFKACQYAPLGKNALFLTKFFSTML